MKYPIQLNESLTELIPAISGLEETLRPSLNMKFGKTSFWIRLTRNKDANQIEKILQRSKKELDQTNSTESFYQWERDINDAYLYLHLNNTMSPKEKARLTKIIETQHELKLPLMKKNRIRVTLEQKVEAHGKRLAELKRQAHHFPTTEKLAAWKQELIAVSTLLAANTDRFGRPNEIVISLAIFHQDNKSHYDNLYKSHQNTRNNPNFKTAEAQGNLKYLAPETKSDTDEFSKQLNWKKTSLVDTEKLVTVWSWSRSFFKPKRRLTFEDYVDSLSNKQKSDKIKTALETNDKSALIAALENHRHGFDFMHIFKPIGLTIYQAASAYKAKIRPG